MKRIAVGVDFSSESELAVAHAMAAARHRGAGLLLLHVGAIVDAPIALPPSMQATADAYQGMPAGRLAADRAQLEELRVRLSGQGVEVSHVVVDARSDGADLLVVGSHGRRGVRRFLIGSVAEATVRHARCSVLVAR